MPDTTNRPTPEQLAGESFRLLARLAEHGYVIVHPDDVPVGDWIDWPADRNHGWNLCRSHIFGDDQ